jgi:hypothetical protein
MKICPRCQKTYADEGLNFCLEDGATLMQSNAAATSVPATVLLNQTPPTAPPNQSFGIQSNWNPNSNQFPIQQPPKKSKTWLWVVGILGGLILLCGGGLTGFVFWAANLENKKREYNTAFNTAYNSNSASNRKTPVVSDQTDTERIDLSKWVASDTSGAGNTEYENGEFVMSSKRKGFYYVLVSSNKYQTENAATKVSARNVNEADTSLGFGLIVHSDPTPMVRDYAFLIDSENKKYRVVRHEPRAEIPIVEWTYSAAIKNGTLANVLEVRDQNNKMSFYINNELATTIDNTDGFIGGVPGLYSSDAIPIAFSDFEIKK